MERKITVLYIAHDTAGHGGAALSLYNLITSVADVVEPVVLCRRDGDFTRMLRDRGIRCLVHDFPLDYELHPGLRHYLMLPAIYRAYCRRIDAAVDRVARMLGGISVDIVHSNSTVFTLGVNLAQRLQVPHIWHLREFIDLDFGFTVMFGKRWLRRQLDKADVCIAISNAVARHWGVQAGRCLVVNDAVAIPQPLQRAKNKTGIILFCAAYLSESKGASECLEAFAASGLTRRGARLRMLGRCSDAYRDKLQELTRTLGVADSVDICGFTPDVASEFANADIFVMASRAEGLGRVTIEAMGAGCVVIAKDAGGTTDIVRDKENGYLYRTVSECADLMRTLWDADTTELTARAVADVTDRFSESRYGRRITAIYTDLLGKN